jgi:hypothetical protein
MPPKNKPPESELSSLLPVEFIKLIRDRIKAGVADAEAKFRLNEEDEDSITGALGQSISTDAPLVLGTPSSAFSFEIESIKLRGRGLDAPEKKLGADAIFQIRILRDGKIVFSKGLPFQAKKGGGFRNAVVKKQAKDLYASTETGIVVRYANRDYTAADVRDILPNADGSSKLIKTQKLSTILGDTFLDCGVGRIGLLYTPESTNVPGAGTFAITTTVRILE